MRWRWWTAIGAMALPVVGCSGGAETQFVATAAGVGVSVIAPADVDGTATGASFSAPASMGPVTFYRGDGDLVGSRVAVERGMTLDTGFVVLPDCGADVGTPVVEVEFDRTDGTPHVDAIEIDRDGYAEAIADWCAAGLLADSQGGSVSPEGTTTVNVRLGNPGPEAATVSVRQQAGDPWEPASIVIAPGTTSTLAVSAPGHVSPIHLVVLIGDVEYPFEVHASDPISGSYSPPVLSRLFP